MRQMQPNPVMFGQMEPKAIKAISKLISDRELCFLSPMIGKLAFDKCVDI